MTGDGSHDVAAGAAVRRRVEGELRSSSGEGVSRHQTPFRLEVVGGLREGLGDGGGDRRLLGDVHYLYVAAGAVAKGRP